MLWKAKCSSSPCRPSKLSVWTEGTTCKDLFCLDSGKDQVTDKYIQVCVTHKYIYKYTMKALVILQSCQSEELATRICLVREEYDNDKENYTYTKAFAKKQWRRDCCMKLWESQSSYPYVSWLLYTLHIHMALWPYWPLVLQIVVTLLFFKLLHRKNVLQILTHELDICSKFSCWITVLQVVWMNQNFFLFQTVVAVHFLQFVVKPWVTKGSPN